MIHDIDKLCEPFGSREKAREWISRHIGGHLLGGATEAMARLALAALDMAQGDGDGDAKLRRLRGGIERGEFSSLAQKAPFRAVGAPEDVWHWLPGHELLAAIDKLLSEPPPPADAARMNLDPERLRRLAEREDGGPIGVGGLMAREPADAAPRAGAEAELSEAWWQKMASDYSSDPANAFTPEERIIQKMARAGLAAVKERDALKAEVARFRELQDEGYMPSLHEVEKERDDLRAKLAEAHAALERAKRECFDFQQAISEYAAKLAAAERGQAARAVAELEAIYNSTWPTLDALDTRVHARLQELRKEVALRAEQQPDAPHASEQPGVAVAREVLQRLYDACVSLESGGISLASGQRDAIFAQWDAACGRAYRLLRDSGTQARGVRH